MTGTIHIIGGTDVEYDTEVPASTEVAMETVKRELAIGAKLFDGGTQKEIDDPKGEGPGVLEREKIVSVRPMAGG